MQTDNNFETTMNLIKSQINKNKVVLYMKGSIENPQCGFSANIIKIIRNVYKGEIKAIDVLKNLNIRKILPIYADWPTFPQLYINSELIGGYDIVLDMFENKELQSLFKNL